MVAGWLNTGDTYRQDADGYFWFVARADDMIVSSGYNIAGPEVEAALLAHPAVAECAVVAHPDVERGHIASHATDAPVESRSFSARVFWLHDLPLQVGPATMIAAEKCSFRSACPCKSLAGIAMCG